MNSWFSPKSWFIPAAVIVATGTALLPTSEVSAADITFDATGSAAYQAAGNWAGGVLPGENDVAQIGVKTPSAGVLSIALSHAAYTPKNEIRSAAIRILAERTTNLTLRSNNNSNSSYYLLGATLHGIADTILVNESNADFSIEPLTSSNSGTMSLVLRAGERHVIQARGAGNITLTTPIVGNGSSLVINSSGTGTVFLSGASSYSGGTIVERGHLAITTNGAIGTGALILNGGTASVAASVTLNHPVLFTGEATLHAAFSSGSSFQGLSAQSNLGARDVRATLLHGNASADRTVAISFTEEAIASNDELRISDAFSLTGTGGDLFVLELQLSTSSGEGAFLAWLNDDGEWVNATLGNTATGSSAINGFNGSFADSGALASGEYLGSWGYDAANHAVWAILDHNSTFSVAAIPEPGSVWLLAATLGLFVGLRRSVPRR